MYSNHPQSGGGPKGSGIYQAISAIGAALGIGASILLTPVVFRATVRVVYNFLLPYWGHDIASFLTWGFGAVEAFLIYAVTQLGFTFAVTCWIASLASRNFPDR